MSLVFSDKEKLKQKLQEDKVKKIYGANTPYLKRSELTKQDIELLRYQYENYDEILFTANSIQELKIILSRLHNCSVSEVEIFNTGEIKVKGLYVNRWRYTEIGKIEYYVPAINSLNTQVEKYDNDFDEVEDLEYFWNADNPEENEGQKSIKNYNNVIKGPW